MIKCNFAFSLAFVSALLAAPPDLLPAPAQDFLQSPKASLSAAAAPTAAAVDEADGSTVAYTAFNGEVVTMRRFNGKYTALLLRQVDLDTVGLARVRKILDEHDIVFETYRTLVGQLPSGTGLLLVAIVPHTNCGPGCASQGVNRIELTQDVLKLPNYMFFLIHEMGHTFDNFSSYIYGGPDRGHAWTMFFDNYVKLYLGLSNEFATEGLNAPDFFNWRMRKVFEPYETYPGADWAQCISNATCDPAGIVDPAGMAMSAQGGLVMKLAELYGTTALTGWLSNVRTLMSQRPVLPATDLEREEFFIESLAKTLNADLSCLFDQLHWPVSAALRARLAQYGAASAFCADADFDGYSRIKHDCNDASAAVHPGAVETVNGVDDDCDGMKDNPVIQETGTAPFPSDALHALPVTLPVKLVGAAASTAIEDRDCFEFTLSAADSIRFTFNSKGYYQGYVTLRTAVPDVETYAYYVWPGDVATFKRGLPAGKTITCLYAYDAPGAYELDISKGYPYPMAEDITPVTFTPAKANAILGGKYLLPVPAVPASLTGRAGLATHFWVSGAGDVGSIPSTSTTPFSWTPAAGGNAPGATYRVDFTAGGIPVHPWSQPQSLLGPVGWTSQDIGSVSLPGAFSRFGEQTLTVQASGADIWGTADGFRFTYLPLTGNGEVIAKIQTLALSNAAAKGGVMLRESLLPGSKNVFMGLQGNSQATFQVRSATGGASVNTKRAATAPLWLKLSRAGDVFTAFSSTDGAAWSPLGNPVTVPMAASVYAGLAVTSHTNAVSTSAGFSNATVVSATALPSPWVSRNVGSVGVAGDASMSGGVLTVNGSGADVWGAADAFRYVYFPVVGNAQLTAKVTSVQNTNAWAKAGVMIRENLAAGSSNAFMAITPVSGATFQSRIATGSASTSTVVAGGAPKWVRITRVGNLLTGYVSDNGTAWTQVGSKSISMASSVLVGVAVTSHNNTALSKVTVQDLNPN